VLKMNENYSGECDANPIGKVSDLADELRTLKAPSEIGQVKILFGRLKSDTEKLLQVIDVLTAKLSPVLFQNEPESCDEASKEASTCELASGLRNESVKVRAAIRSIQKLTKDIQL